MPTPTTTSMHSRTIQIREKLSSYQAELDRVQAKIDLVQKAYQLGMQAQIEYTLHLGDLLCSSQGMRSALGLCKEALSQIDQALIARSAAAVDLVAGGTLDNYDVIAAASNEVANSDGIIISCQAQAEEYLRIFRVNSGELVWPAFTWS